MNTLSDLVRVHRQAKNLLIRQVAAELGIDPSLLSRIERGDKKRRGHRWFNCRKLLRRIKISFWQSI